MKTYKFYKEAPNRWYIDLPEWKGSKADLEMVAGADHMLDYMAEGENEVYLVISEEWFERADSLKLLQLNEYSGADYFLEKYRGIDIQLKMWLCDVTKFVFGKFPETIYISKI